LEKSKNGGLRFANPPYGLQFPARSRDRNPLPQKKVIGRALAPRANARR
jgi:hypothetical protein